MKTGSAILSQPTLIYLLIVSAIISALLSPSIHAEPAPAQALHSQQNIIQVSRDFLRANIDSSAYSRVEIEMGRLDPRLRLKQCDIPLTATLAPGSRFAGKTTVHIRCGGTSPWTVYLGAHIHLYAQVIQTAAPLSKGHILNKGDLVAREEDLSRIKYGYFTDTKHLIGKQLKRHLPQQRIIQANYVKSPTLVKRGEIVSIVAKTSGYSVKMTGTAMMNGARGDRIRVKNLSSRRIVEGIVKESGVVSIN